jgi:hypothetical protein
MQKYIFNGQVALIHSDNWGTAWATWYPETMFDGELIKLYLWWQDTEPNSQLRLQVEDAAYFYLKETHPDVTYRGFDGLRLTWLPEGQEFFIREYDGIETIVLKQEMKWMVA